VTDTCLICDRALSGQAYACQVCAGQVTTWLTRAASLVLEVETTLSGQAVTGSNASSGGQGDLSSAAQLADAALVELGTWAQILARTQGRKLVLHQDLMRGPVCPRCAHTSCDAIRDLWRPEWMPSVCRFLAANTHTIAGMPWAVEALPRLEAACRTIERIVDRPDPGVMVGLCACGKALYGLSTASWVSCPECGQAWDIQAVRDALVAHTASLLMTPAEIATLAAQFGISGSREQIRKRIHRWKERGIIAIRGIRSGDPLLQVGETLAVLARGGVNVDTDLTGSARPKAA